MAVTRISKESLEDLLRGKVKEDATCVLKFYSNECHLCHALQDYFVGISDLEKYRDLHFFAYNIDDNPKIEVEATSQLKPISERGLSYAFQSLHLRWIRYRKLPWLSSWGT